MDASRPLRASIPYTWAAVFCIAAILVAGGKRADERDHGRQERDRLMGLLRATQRQLEDQTRSRSIWSRLTGRR